MSTDTDTDTDVLEPVSEPEAPDNPDLPAELEKTAPRRWTNRATPVLFGLVLLSGGFLGGVAVDKQWGRHTTTTAAPTERMPFAFPSGGPPMAGGDREATTGTIESVTATGLTMKTTAGRTVTVKIADSTKVQQTVTLAKLQTGQSVTVQGSTATDGSITATSVTGS